MAMDMFERQEAFDFISNFLKIQNAEQRMKTDKRALLDDLAYSLSCRMPFQNLTLMSVAPKDRKKPSLLEVKKNFTSGQGGLCMDINIMTFYLLSAIGFDAWMVHVNVSVALLLKNSHVCILINDVEKKGDQFLVDVATGYPMPRAIDMSFEKESPVYFDGFLEYKFVRHGGQVLKMQRKGDFQVMSGKRENPKAEFWLDGWRRFLYFDLVDNAFKDYAEFENDHEAVVVNPLCTPFHSSHRLILFPEGKASIVINGKHITQNENGELVTTDLSGGDEEIKTVIQRICPAMPDDVVTNSLYHWRQTMHLNQ